MTQQTQLFVTCLVDSLFPEVGVAVVEVLTRAGESVRFPRAQTCCGQPAFNSGYQQEARRMAQHTLEVFGATDGPIVLPSGSCAAMLVHGYIELFKEDPFWLPRAKALAARTYEFSQYLVDELNYVETSAFFHGSLAFHPSCHLLRDLGVEKQPISLLEQVRGVQIKPLEAECCGFGGAFSIDHEVVSSEMLSRRLSQVGESESQVVVSCDVSCLLHIEGGLRKRGSKVRCAHLAQILAGKSAGLK
ncbi:MAG: (Fe-S)-binding protein [Chloroflexi bacterium]|nr:(Fe-S)-binding protein [Chloroflexota bacterium]